MDDAQLGPILQKLDTEVFFGILDVALDIDGVLAVTDQRPVYIQGMRTVIRYSMLYPGHSVGAA
jgi:hypothetical protein